MANIYDDDEYDYDPYNDENKKKKNQKQTSEASSQLFVKNYDISIENIIDHTNNGIYMIMKFVCAIPFIIILVGLYYDTTSFIIAIILSLILAYIIKKTIKSSVIFEERQLKNRLKKGSQHIFINSAFGYSEITCELKNGKKEIYKIKKSVISHKCKSPQVELTNKGISVVIPYSTPIMVNISEEEQEM